MTPKVSVIVPCYNAEKYLGECLDSIIAQTYKNFEIIVINDGSSDNTLSIIENYLLKYNFIHLLNQDNQGVIIARNNGIKQAKGEYILPVDADDKIAPIFLEKAVAILDTQQNIGIVGGGTKLFGLQEGIMILPPYRFPNILSKNSLVVSCMYRKSDWQKVGGYNENMKYCLEDYDFWLSLVEIGVKVYQFDDVFLYYRKLDSSRTKKKKDIKTKQMLEQIVLNHPNLYNKYPKEKNKLLGIMSTKDRIKKILLNIFCLFLPVKSLRHKIKNRFL